MSNTNLKLQQQYSKLGEAFTSPIQLSPLQAPKWGCWNQQAADELSIEKSDLMLDTFNRGETRDGDIQPAHASAYSGHQFGVWAGQLGDGRAATLGQLINNNSNVEIQTKGGGETPYSRGGDGRAVLRSTIREFLCSEAMHHLNICTTRALAVIDSDTPVMREGLEKGALLVRFAPTHIRFGTFEHFKSRNQITELKQLADFVIQYHYPECAKSDNVYLALFQAVVAKTALLIAKWQAFGFTHGVMNTDNMSIIGLTLDYGPFAFMQNYDPSYICNQSDHQGRYAFEQQPRIAHWNLSALGNAFLSFADIDNLKDALQQYPPMYHHQYNRLMCLKLGIEKPNEQDTALYKDLLQLMFEGQVDYSIAFRLLSKKSATDSFKALFDESSDINAWIDRYQTRIAQLNPASVEKLRLANNPKYILRNYMAQIAIEKAEQGDYSELEHMLKIVQQPFAEQPENDMFAKEPPEWSKSLSLSCSA